MLNVSGVEAGIDEPEVLVGDQLEHHAGCLGFRAPHDTEDLDDVGVVEAVCDKQLPLDFGGTDSSEDLDRHLLPMLHIGALKDVGVLASADLPNDLVRLLAAEITREATPTRSRSSRSPALLWACAR